MWLHRIIKFLIAITVWKVHAVAIYWSSYRLYRENYTSKPCPKGELIFTLLMRYSRTLTKKQVILRLQLQITPLAGYKITDTIYRFIMHGWSFQHNYSSLSHVSINVFDLVVSFCFVFLLIHLGDIYDMNSSIRLFMHLLANLSIALFVYPFLSFFPFPLSWFLN